MLKSHLPPIMAVMLSLPVSSFAGTTGSLEGFVTDSDTDQPLVGANIQLPSTRQGASTDTTGFFKIHNIRAGSYAVQISMIGYRLTTSSDIVILPDRRSKLNVSLKESPIELEAMEVVSQSPLIKTDITGTSYEIDADVLINLPIDSFSEVVALQPGTTVEGNIRGGKVREALYLIDGLPVQDVIQGGLGTELPKSAILQMSVKTGGFDAEYGNALSGVINVITRTGGDDHEFSLRAAKDNLLGGTEVSKRNELEFMASGPIVSGGALSYFSATSAVLTDTRWWQDMQHFFDSPVRKELSGLGKVDYLMSPTSRLTAEVLYSFQRWRDYEFSWRYNLDGLPPRLRDSYRAALLWTHALSSNVFYNISLSHFSLHSKIGQGRAQDMSLTPYEFDFFLLYITEGDRTWWADSQQDIYTLKAAITNQIHPYHLVKAGVEFHQYDIDSDLRKLEPQTTYFGKPLVFEPLLNYSTQYHYYPRSGSLYIQDKIEAGKSGSVVNFGLRFDFLDPRAQRPAVELVPDDAESFGEEGAANFVDAKIKHNISPRFGCSFPMTENSFFFVNYGRYVQYPLFDHLYSGLNNVSLREGVSVLRGNPDLLAERTTAWEVSVRYDIARNVVASAAYFNKETRDQIDTKTFVATNSRIAGDYGFAEFVNNPYANVSGFEFTISRTAGKRMRGNFSYAFMEAEGLSDYVDQGLNYAQWGFPLVARPFKLSWDQRHTLKADVEIDLPYAATADVVWQFHSGRPYTFFPSSDGFTADTKRSFLPNNERMPRNNLFSLRLSREFHPGSGYAVIAYVDSRNILNAKNVRWMDSSGRVGGELRDPASYYPPRRTMLGIRTEI